MILELDEGLIKTFKILGKITHEANFSFDDKGLHIFDDCYGGNDYIVVDYSCKAKEEKPFRLDLRMLSAIIKNTGAKDTIIMDTGKEGTVEFKINAKTFTMKKLVLKDMEHGKKELESKLHFDVKIHVMVDKLMSALKEAMLMNDDALFFFTTKGEEKLYIRAEGDGGEYSNSIDASGDNVPDAMARYAFEYMKRIMDNDFIDMTIEFSNDQPLRITFEEENIIFNFYVVPRLE
jgi:hypothetical protein